MDELKQIGCLLRRYYGKKELVAIAKEKGIQLSTSKDQEIIEG